MVARKKASKGQRETKPEQEYVDAFTAKHPGYHRRWPLTEKWARDAHYDLRADHPNVVILSVLSRTQLTAVYTALEARIQGCAREVTNERAEMARTDHVGSVFQDCLYYAQIRRDIAECARQALDRNDYRCGFIWDSIIRYSLAEAVKIDP